MHDDIESHLKPSRLRTTIWAVLMVAIIVGSGVMLWRAYQLKQSAIFTEEALKTAYKVRKGEGTSARGKASEQEEETTGETADNEFVARVEHTVNFTRPPADINASDPWLRQHLSLVDPHPQFKRWLDQTSDLMRQFVLLADQVSKGKLPRKVFSFWRPKESFKVRESEGKLVIDPQGYHRYDLLAEVVDAIDMELTWRLYQLARPLVREAFAEIAPSGKQFDQVLLAAAEHLLETPQPRGEIVLVKPSVMYQFADPKLESLSAAQKQLLRMGPINATIIKHKLGILRGYLLREANQATRRPELPLP